MQRQPRVTALVFKRLVSGELSQEDGAERLLVC